MIRTNSSQPTLLIIDQFEEAFTLCRDEEERQIIVENLLNMIQARGPRHTLLLTMRIDYESSLATLPLLQSLVDQNSVRVTAMNSAELREAIDKPAERVGLKFQEGLIDEIIREILGEPAALPLLQFTLLQLWENRERNRITWETYERLGGVHQALAVTANRIYEALLPEGQITARRIMLRLVQPGEGLEVTRNRIQRRMLYQSGEAHDRVDRVLDKFVQTRLIHLTKGITREDDQVEVTHEALVRNWPRLVNWLDEERETFRKRMRLTTLAQQWENLGQDPDALIRGTLLREVSEFTGLNDLEQEFIPG